MDFILRFITLILLVGIGVFWFIMQIISEKQKPKTKVLPWYLRFERNSFLLLAGIIVLQLFGLSLFPIAFLSPFIQFIGFVFVVMGVLIGFWARVSLGNNWTVADEYQIKKGHELITSGIYSYIRHPMYFCFLLCSVGAELVVTSWLFLPFIGIYFYLAYKNGKREERLLLNHFGEAYKKYMKRTKMLIPFIY